VEKSLVNSKEGDPVKKRILITGATGFIAGGVIKAIQKEGIYELFLTAENAESLTLQGYDINIIPLDLSRTFDSSALPAAMDHIVHLAQCPDYRLFPDSAVAMFNVNTASTQSLLDYGRKAGITSFVFTSTGNVYDPALPARPFKEDDPVKQSDFYSASKIASEMLTSLYYKYFYCTTFRIFACYGEKQKGRLIASLIERVRKSEDITIYGTEGMRINPIHIDDTAKYIVWALSRKESSLFNMGGCEALSIREIAVTIGDVLGREARFNFIPDSMQRDLVGDITRLTTASCFSPEVSFRQGIERMVQV